METYFLLITGRDNAGRDWRNEHGDNSEDAARKLARDMIKIGETTQHLEEPDEHGEGLAAELQTHFVGNERDAFNMGMYLGSEVGYMDDGVVYMLNEVPQ